MNTIRIITQTRRKGFDGLLGLVRNYLNKDPTTGDLFVF
jgi:hypothetical protein